MIYVLSDIHGNLRRFNSIMKQIQLRPSDTLYVLGDVIDRHPYGIKILRQIMVMPNAKMLLGNHEYMMMNSIDLSPDGTMKSTFAYYLWYRNGGEVTHKYLKHIRKDLRIEIFNYLESLPLEFDVTVNNQKYKLVHGAPLEMFEHDFSGREYANAKEYSVWKRWFSFGAIPDDYIMVFGHTPTSHYQMDDVLKIYHGKNCIGIDCGSGFPDAPFLPYQPNGRLSCLRLDDMKEFYSEENYGE